MIVPLVQGDVKLKALHALQKLMARPDAGEVFKKFDTDGNGALQNISASWDSR